MLIIPFTIRNKFVNINYEAQGVIPNFMPLCLIIEGSFLRLGGGSESGSLLLEI